MKKGISLIVLVITIIVMIIIAGAIIISLNSTNVIKRSEEAVLASNVAELKAAVALEYANDYTAWVAYKTGVETDEVINEPSLTTINSDVVLKALDNVNNNTLDKKYEIIWVDDHGPLVQEDDGSDTVPSIKGTPVDDSTED